MVSYSPRPHKVKDLTGMRYGRLVVISRVDPDTIYQPMRMKRALWVCKCDCGKETVVRGSDLRSKDGVKSCGCLKGRPKKGETSLESMARRSLPPKDEPIEETKDEPIEEPKDEPNNE